LAYTYIDIGDDGEWLTEPRRVVHARLVTERAQACSEPKRRGVSVNLKGHRDGSLSGEGGHCASLSQRERGRKRAQAPDGAWARGELQLPGLERERPVIAIEAHEEATARERGDRFAAAPTEHAAGGDGDALGAHDFPALQRAHVGSAEIVAP